MLSMEEALGASPQHHTHTHKRYGMDLQSQIHRRQRQEDYLNPGIQDQSREHRKEDTLTIYRTVFIVKTTEERTQVR